MSGVIYLVTSEELLAMESRPYELEDVLQQLLARDGRLLAGASTGDTATRRWILVTRENTVYGASGQAWSADHVFVDDEGVPTVVEVKRGSNTQVRREIVGQLLDYAANLAVSTTVEEMRARFEATLMGGVDPQEALQSRLGVETSADEYWALVGENLARGRIRGYFVADKIPEELRRIVDYLNRQVGESRFLALEVRQFQTADRATTTLVPQIVAGSLEPPVAPGPRRQTETEALHLAFWSQFRDYLEERSSRIRMPKPAGKSLLYLPLAKGALLAPYNLIVKGSSGVQLQLKGPDALARFELLAQRHRGLVDERLARLGHTEWDASGPWVLVWRDSSTPADRATWPELNEWLADALETMQALFVPLLTELDVAEDETDLTSLRHR